MGKEEPLNFCILANTILATTRIIKLPLLGQAVLEAEEKVERYTERYRALRSKIQELDNKKNAINQDIEAFKAECMKPEIPLQPVNDRGDQAQDSNLNQSSISRPSNNTRKLHFQIRSLLLREKRQAVRKELESACEDCKNVVEKLVIVEEDYINACERKWKAKGESTSAFSRIRD